MQLITGYEVSSHVMRLINNADKALYVCSAYMKPWQALDTALLNAIQARKIPTLFIARGGNDTAKNAEVLLPYKKAGAQVTLVNRLHAKFFMNETEAIVGSMNLLESSAVDSWEIAFRVTRADDEEAYKQVLEAFSELIKLANQEVARKQLAAEEERKHAEEERKRKTAAAISSAERREIIRANIDKMYDENGNPRTQSPEPSLHVVPDQGHCIRCDATIALNPDKPHCRTCWTAWSKFSNPTYVEAHCHGCGKAMKTSVAKPLCKPCWAALS